MHMHLGACMWAYPYAADARILPVSPKFKAPVCQRVYSSMERTATRSAVGSTMVRFQQTIQGIYTMPIHPSTSGSPQSVCYNISDSRRPASAAVYRWQTNVFLVAPSHPQQVTAGTATAAAPPMAMQKPRLAVSRCAAVPREDVLYKALP